jgi:hypothetical protein
MAEGAIDTQYGLIQKSCAVILATHIAQGQAA